MISYVSMESEVEKQVTAEMINKTTSFETVMPVGEIYASGLNSVADEQSLRALLIVINPNICNGRPTILGTRIAVSHIVELHDLLEWGIQKIREEYPYLGEQQIVAALEYYQQNTREIDEHLKEEKEIDIE